MPPGDVVPFGDLGAADVAQARLHDVVVVLVAAEVGLAVELLDALLGHVDAPVDAVDVEMMVAAAGVLAPHVALRVAAEDFADERVLGVAVARPGVVLLGPQIEHVELVGPFVAEQRILELRVAVVAAEIEAEGVLRIEVVAAVAAANPQADVHFEAARCRRD